MSNRKYIYSILLYLGMLSLGKVHAFTQVESLEERLNRLEEQISKLSEKNALDEEGVTTASATPDVCGKKWFFRADLLYWHTKVSGADFVYSNNRVSTAVPIQGRTIKLPFGWDYGYRFGLGRNFYHDTWDVNLVFTSFTSNTSKSVSAGQNSALIPLRGALVTQNYVTSASSSYHLAHYSLDLELGRHYFISGKLSLRPMLGIKNSWFDHLQKIRYWGGPQLGGNVELVRDKNDFWGIGPKMGLSSKWYLGEGFHIFGLITGAILYGFFDIDHFEKISNQPVSQRIKLGDDKHRFTPMVQYSAGLGYGQFLFEHKAYCELQFGYEGQYWWDQNQFIQIYQFNSLRYRSVSEDVSMHGVTASLNIYY